VAFLRRREPLHVRLAREGGLLGSEPSPESSGHPEPLGRANAGVHGVARPRRWDAVGAASSPDLAGEEVTFVALPDGTLLVEDDLKPGSLSPLADAVETSLKPPYRAEAVRHHEDVWAVAARRIRVAELPRHVRGDALELVAHEGRRELSIDGDLEFGTIPALELLAAGRESYVIRAERLDGELWEVVVSPL
jgi:hypothetical protein